MVARGVTLIRPVLGLFALFSGVALLLNIVFQVDLRLGLAALAIVFVGVFASMVRRASDVGRRTLVRSLGYGAVAGVLATLAYDVARVALAEIDPSPYRPFEAITRFGQLLLASEARDAPVVLAGALYHALNGATFGIAFILLFAANGQKGFLMTALLGSGWGLFLEMFQLALYPNWLGIRYLNEFVSISATGHIAYGLTLAVVGRGLLRRAAEHGDGETREGIEDD
jgi:hypothetical protein